MFFLNMVDYPVFFPSLSTLTWDTFLTLRGTWGFYLNHVLPPRPSKSYRVVVLVVGWGGGCKCKHLEADTLPAGPFISREAKRQAAHQITMFVLSRLAR